MPVRERGRSLFVLWPRAEGAEAGSPLPAARVCQSYIERYVAGLISGLAEQGYSVDLLARPSSPVARSLQPPGRFVPLLEPLVSGAGAREETLGVGADDESLATGENGEAADAATPPVSLDAIAAGYAEQLRDAARGYDLIVSHGLPAGMLATRMAAALGLPHLYAPHELPSSSHFEPTGHEPAPELSRTADQPPADAGDSSEPWGLHSSVVASASGALVSNFAQRDSLVQPPICGDAERVHFAPHGYDPQQYLPASPRERARLRQELGFCGPTALVCGAARTALTAGQHAAENMGEELELVLRAIAVLAARHPECSIRWLLPELAADQSELAASHMAALERWVAERGLSERILLAPIGDSPRAAIFRAADLVLDFGGDDPFGVAALEGMACGVPTILAASCGLADEVQWGTEALVEDPRQAEGFGHLAAAVWSHPRLAAQLSLGGAVRARTSYTWAEVARQFVAGWEATAHLDQAAEAAVDTDDPAIREGEAAWIS